MKNTDVRRHTIQNALAPAIESALAGIEKLDMTRPEDMRRFFRALVHIGADHLLNAGCPPQTIAGFAVEAIAREVEARTNALTVEAAPTFPVFSQTVATA